MRVRAAPGAGWAFEKFTRRAQDWAIVGVAVQERGGVGLVNMATTPVRAGGVEAALAAGSSLRRRALGPTRVSTRPPI